MTLVINNVLIVATSNRRHLIPEKMKDNQGSEMINGELHQSDTIEEKMSLSDRFGLSLSFYPLVQEDYFAIVDMLFTGVQVEDIQQLHVLAGRFARERGSRNGRIAQKFYNDWCECVVFLLVFFFWNWVIPAIMPRVTFPYSLHT